jgi:hypothetical protein
MHRDAADALALLDDEHLLAELGGLDSTTATGRAAPHNNEIVLKHGSGPRLKSWNHIATQNGAFTGIRSMLQIDLRPNIRNERDEIRAAVSVLRDGTP